MGIAAGLTVGIVLSETAGIAVLFVILLVMCSCITYNVISKKISAFYYLIPIAVIAGFIDMKYAVSIYENNSTEKSSVTGMVYLVKEKENNYELYIREDSFGRKRCIVYSDEYIEPGKYVVASGEILDFNEKRNPGEFDLAEYYHSLKIKYRINNSYIHVIDDKNNVIYNWAGRVSRKIDNVYKRICESSYASSFSAMVLGKKDDCDKEFKNLFSLAGIGHILAISGLHISLIGMGLYKLIRRMGCNFLLSMAISTGVILFYGIMTGNSVSTIRAVIMSIAAMYANFVGRTYDMMSAAALSAIIALADSPMLIFNCSFLLSYMAIIGIVYINRAFTTILNPQKKLTKNFICGLSIQLSTLPITLYFFYKLPLLSVFINLLVIPLMSVVMSSAIFAGISGIFAINLGKFLIGPAVYIMQFFVWLCRLGEKTGWQSYIAGEPALWKIAVYYIMVIIFIYLSEKKKLFSPIFVAFGLTLILIKPVPDFETYFIDVGQGDCTYINSKGTRILIDGGSSTNGRLYEYTLLPFLQSKGCDTLDYIFVSHTDKDHISGIIEILKKNDFKVKNMVLPDIETTDELYEELYEYSVRKKCNIIKLHKGMSFKFQKMQIQSLGPDKSEIYDDINDASEVLYVSYKNFSILFTGDISQKTEETLIKSGNLKNVTFLKAAHHGSKNSSSPDFLGVVKPKYTIISCGKNNRYGHPHGETLERLEDIGTKVIRTDEAGAIEVLFRDEKVALSEYGAKAQRKRK